MSATDMAYASADGVTLLTRVHRPAAGTGLGHAIVMVHGGAWTMNDRITPEVVCSELARRGLVVFSLDFRHGPDFKHPSASCDIAAGVRFVRLHAADFDVDPDTIGLIGSSSGGHLVLLTGIKPDVPVHRGTRVADLDGGFVDPVEVSAAVRYVVALWPVSDPLRRFRYATKSGRTQLADAHFNYYTDEAAMREASVQRSLIAGEATSLPPVLVVQPGQDENVPREMTLDLVKAYQDAGGELAYLFYPGQPHAFAYEASAATTRCIGDVWAFIERRLADS